MHSLENLVYQKASLTDLKSAIYIYFIRTLLRQCWQLCSLSLSALFFKVYGNVSFLQLTNYIWKIVKFIGAFSPFCFLTFILKCISLITYEVVMATNWFFIAMSKWTIKSSTYFWFSFSEVKTGILFWIIILLNNYLQSNSLLLLMCKSWLAILCAILFLTMLRTNKY